MKKSQINKCKTIADHYGRNSQEKQAVSELMELGYVLTRRPVQRKDTWNEELLDEIADVLIMVQQLSLIYKLSDEDISKKVDEKLDRQLYRIGQGE